MDSPLTLSDEEVLRRSSTERELFAHIIQRYEHKLRLYIQRKSHASPEDIDDLLQNIFIKVYRNIKGFDPSLRFSSWIYRIAYNEMVDWYRKEKRTPHISFDADESILYTIAGDQDTTEKALKEEQKKVVSTALSSLDQIYQDIVELRFYEEKSYEEIGDILQIPPGTVAIRISRVKKILKTLLQNHA
ncbi:MAG: RNA polymerase sigma factor [Candidatus Zambryskibacteria bacterium]|nr:RNA polymerase sigma factor [Candidatus Zambryskibacteria bacterium]